MNQEPSSEAAETVQTTNVPAVDLPRLVRLFRDENRFAGGHYIVKGIEVNIPCGKLRIGRTILPPKVKPPSIFYIGKRHTWTWTIRLWTVAISYLPNDEMRDAMGEKRL